MTGHAQLPMSIHVCPDCRRQTHPPHGQDEHYCHAHLTHGVAEEVRVIPAEVTDEMVERMAREMTTWSGPVPGDIPGFRPFARRALEAAFSTSHKPEEDDHA